MFSRNQIVLILLVFSGILNSPVCSNYVPVWSRSRISSDDEDLLFDGSGSGSGSGDEEDLLITTATPSKKYCQGDKDCSSPLGIRGVCEIGIDLIGECNYDCTSSSTCSSTVHSGKHHVSTTTTNEGYTTSKPKEETGVSSKEKSHDLEFEEEEGKKRSENENQKKASSSVSINSKMQISTLGVVIFWLLYNH